MQIELFNTDKIVKCIQIFVAGSNPIPELASFGDANLILVIILVVVTVENNAHPLNPSIFYPRVITRIVTSDVIFKTL